jgi:hypothetical protein
MASTDPKGSKQGTNGTTKHVTSKIPQKLQIIRKLHSGKVQREDVVSYNSGSLTTYDIKKQTDQLRLFTASRGSVKDLSKCQTMKQPKLAQLDKVLCKGFTAMHSRGKTISRPMIFMFH